MQTIPLINLLYLLLPLIIVWYFYKSWVGNQTEILYATIRMVVQLLAIGYLLLILFENKHIYMGIVVISFMLIVSTWICIRNIKNKTKSEYINVFISSTTSSLIHLILILYFVLGLVNIYEPQYVIPLAGMVFANNMNGLSLAIERFESEYDRTKDFITSRRDAFKASMIPQINSLLAVGLVSLPGMMTGQILSGVDPLIAVRYQIMIMSMVLSGTGLSIVIYFLLKQRSLN
ncbi:ABC transporter permease [Arcobacter roscoffensis]|uniref:ABC transporter permease n=1 Tax=Arcobacter roscoffensis TaxID=2961520 RepID=A0ABY5E2Z3_9BACT|nr:ABC transporter permease [Arcobacter roscoffensis]UTJ06554.1 ABC transporter permease [Arcobacter roscoffensis]